MRTIATENTMTDTSDIADARDRIGQTGRLSEAARNWGSELV